MAFFWKYLEVVPNNRIVWTNEESGDALHVPHRTLEERRRKTLLVMSVAVSHEGRSSGQDRRAEATLETFGQTRRLC